jgi:gliding motility-associated-like protein
MDKLARALPIILFTLFTPFWLFGQSQLCRNYGGPGDELCYALVEATDGGYIMAGQTNSFGAGGIDVYVVKINVQGNIVWTKTIGGTGSDYAYSMDVTSDGGYILGGTTTSFGAGGEDMYFVKLDAGGNIQWTKTVGGSGSDRGHEVVQTTDGGYAMAGETNSFGGSPDDMYVVKLDGAGNLLWDKRYGTASIADQAFSITATSDGGLALCGSAYFFIVGNIPASSNEYYITKLDATGNLQWTRLIRNPDAPNIYPDYARSIIQTADGGYMISGEGGRRKSSGGFVNKILLIKLDASGNVSWTRFYGSTAIPGFSADNSEYGESVIQTSDGGYVVAGYSFSYNYDFVKARDVGLELYLIKVDGNGNLLWTRIIGEQDNDIGKAVIATSDGGFAVAGYVQPRVAGARTDDFYFVKLDSNLDNCCTTRSGGTALSSAATNTTRGGEFPGGGTATSGGTAANGGVMNDLCNLNLQITIDSTNVKCKGICDGSATATASGGSAPYTFSWSNGSTEATASGLCAGTYTVFVEDNAGNRDTAFVSITEPASALTGSFQKTDVSCNASCNGSATASAQGGTPAYSFLWNTNPAQNTATAGNLCAGNYTCIITDNKGCRDTLEIPIIEPTPIEADTSTNPANCGNSDGSASLSNTRGGTGPYTFSWNSSPPQSNATASNLLAGTYTVTISDSRSCTIQLTVIVPSLGGGTATIEAQDVSCFGQANGSLRAIVSGGTSPFNYSWNSSPVQSTALANNLLAGTYTCTITDAANCVIVVSGTVDQPEEIIAQSSTVNSDCGASNGSASIQVISGGSAPYTYSWNTTPEQTSATASGLPAGSYICTITDDQACEKTINVIVANNNAASASGTATQVSCPGGSNGRISVLMNGGTQPFIYSWNTNPPQNGSTAENLKAGIYSCTITDANNCVAVYTDTITEPGAFVVEISHIPACGLNSGTAAVSVSGGTAPYSYSWSPGGATGPVLQGATAGEYVLTFSDANTCTGADTVQIQTLPVPQIDAGPDEEINIGESVELLVSGSSGAYYWEPGASLSCTDCPNPLASPLQTTTYTVSITAPNGCTNTDTVMVLVNVICGEVFVPNAFSPNGDGENDALCVYGNCFKTLRTMIFDRWGEKVFDSESTKPCWDGTFRDQPMNSAVFGYYIEGTLFTGEEIKRKGEINLIR